MSSPLSAALPHVHAAVRASAGTGKTWLLVTRLVHLLMTGAPPQGILAITFTRKAAAEMHARLLERLFELAGCDDARLETALAAMGISADAASRRAARGLYEGLLATDAQIHITTFHAFCQGILRRFPLEAEVPPGFEVAEDTGLLEQAAWDALFAESTREPDGTLARALEALFVQCNGLQGAQQVLGEFLQRRSDWLAYTQDSVEPAATAAQRLSERLGVDSEQSAAERFFTVEIAALLAEFHALLLRHPIDRHVQCAERLERAADEGHPPERRLAWARGAFFTQSGTPMSRKANQTLAKKLGGVGMERFLALHDRLCAELEHAREYQSRRDTLCLSRAWYVAGARLLAHYQAIKAEQRLLDFADLEWSAYRLLSRNDYMQWVQYKLDQALEHVLIDEFQDTNPTQWHLIRPLLQELACGDDARRRTAFLVGDEKQSIYRFRRAEPALFDAAVAWVGALPDAVVQPLDLSYRSAPAIVDFVNRVFAAGEPGDRLAGFNTHGTHRRDLWGRVEVYPALAAPAADPPAPHDATELRNPLLRPRPGGAADGHYAEGRDIAARIHALMTDTLIGAAQEARALRYGDIALLVRDRSHAASYELALRDAGIPYLGISRGGLLGSLEVRDMLALLRVLTAPYDALALATVLRSPLFACSDQDLMAIAGAAATPARNGIEQLAAVAAGLPDAAPLARAFHWLVEWRDLADTVPVHDLLDRIYCEGDVAARYEAAFPPHLRGRVRANLTRFIELALEVDSGRYPSLIRFMEVLDNLRARGRAGPDEGPPPGVDAVRLMTIHAAKGLEWPVVFLADAAWSKTQQRSYHPMVVWPAGQDRPSHFFVTGKRTAMDDLSTALYRDELEAQLREEANLLYVALTRARQLLIITGCTPARPAQASWLDLIAARIAPDGLTEPWGLETGVAPGAAARPPVPPPAARVGDPRLRRPLQDMSPTQEINPSRSAAVGDDRDEDGAGDGPAARRRGTAIHRMLELLAGGRAAPGPRMPPAVAAALDGDPADPDLASWWREACGVFSDPRLAEVFAPQGHSAAYNEIPIAYELDGRRVYGVIDRLVVRDHEVLLVDYKTHARATRADLPGLAAAYAAALDLYRRGVERLWPGRPVRAALLFTACGALIEAPGGA